MDPQDTQFAQSPMSPPEAMGESTMGAPGGLPPEQMLANLQDMKSKLEGKYQDFNSQKFVLDNTRTESKGALLREIFSFFESVGVDPSNPEEVNTYLETLKTENPEMFQQIESVLKMALGEEEEEPVPEGTEQNMNINPDEAIQQNP